MAAKQGSGLDLDLGNRCSAIACRWGRTTAAARQGRPGQLWDGLEASFSSVLEIGGQRLALTSDGIGTKIEVAERVGRYDTLGWDLVAMVADDLAANGVEPTNLSNILDVDHLDEGLVEALMQGLAEACRASGIAVTGGEIAELGDRVGGWGPRMHFNWCATALGVLSGPPVDGSKVAVGDAVISLAERGFRSNGFSRVRRIMAETFGPLWHEARFDAQRTWGEALLTPSLVCAPAVTRLLADGVVPHGVANVTGGGIPDKLGRVLRGRRLGAELTSLHPPPDFMAAVQDLGKLPDEVAFRSWNMGNAMLLVLAPAEVDRALARVRSVGFEAKVAGSIIPDPVLRLGVPGRGPVMFGLG